MYRLEMNNMPIDHRTQQHPGVVTETTSFLHRERTSSSTDGSTNHSEDTDQQIPFIIWMVMKICCVFYQRPLVGSRRCLHCQVKTFRKNLSMMGKSGPLSEYFPDEFDPCGQGYKESYTVNDEYRHRTEQNSCQLCESFWWTTDNRTRTYTDEDIAVGYWNHRGSWLLSVTLPCLSVTFSVYEFISYSYYQNKTSRPYDVVHDVSYFIFLAELSLYPIFSLYTKLRTSTHEAVPARSWAIVFNSRYLVKRMQFINFAHQGIPGKMMLFLCLAWPMELLTHRTLIYLGLCPGLIEEHQGFSSYWIISLAFTFSLMLCWACSQYLMFLCRISFVRQFQLVRAFVKRNQTDIDSCRMVVWHAVCDFNSYREFVYMYMRLMIPISAWGMTTVLFWQYSDDDTMCPNILWMIWSQIGMFMGISLSSSGGLDVSYMWKHFQQMMLTMERDAETQRFWREMSHHLDYLRGDHEYHVRWTIGLSFASVIMAVYSSDNVSDN